ncbi:MAG TPA: farnesyl diphosphate synthase [Candidatus Deferrimicrobium sp.]|nr:farnesyl diphosphate synthase [Candidatus Deferrimicrobium sp.]
MTLQTYLTEKNKLVESCLDQWLPREDAEPAKLHQAMRYSLFAGGKRIRPILTIAAAEAVDGDISKVLPAATALELIHTYSLIHDDLPAMDDDDYRRGRLSNHKMFGEATAILAGDALLTFAFELLVRESIGAGVEAEKITFALLELSSAAGTFGMIGGQAMDLSAEGQKVNLDGLETIHKCKTGALLRAAVRIGAGVSGANQEQLQALTSYAESLGLAFQIKDDILDIEGDSQKLGKQAGSDLLKDKSTYPSILGLQEAKRLLNQQIDNSLQSADIFAEKGKILRDIALFVRDREF